MEYDFDACLVQEHSTPKYMFQDTVDLIRQFELKTFLSPTDPECTSPTGGVGMLYRSGLRVIKLKTMTLAFQEIQDNGR
eukprot:2405044-Karenia_brevis.AAC.1